MAKVNPIHYKPTWCFARFAEDADEMMKHFGKNSLALTDVEMITIRVALKTFVNFYDGSGDDTGEKLACVCASALSKIERVLNVEFEETEP